MNRKLASTLSIASTAAAIFAAAAMASGSAYADDITIDTTPFVSTRTRAEVRAEVKGQAEQLRIASSEFGTHSQPAPTTASGYTRAQAKAEYITARDQVHALNAEDSGSSYLAAMQRGMNAGVVVAGQSR
jgi:predicted nucleic acid-binding protein